MSAPTPPEGKERDELGVMAPWCPAHKAVCPATQPAPEPSSLSAEDTALALVLRQAARKYLGHREGDYWDSGIAAAQATALMTPDGPITQIVDRALADERRRAGEPEADDGEFCCEHARSAEAEVDRLRGREAALREHVEAMAARYLRASDGPDSLAYLVANDVRALLLDAGDRAALAADEPEAAAGAKEGQG